MAVEIENRKYK